MIFIQGKAIVSNVHCKIDSSFTGLDGLSNVRENDEDNVAAL